LTFFNITVIKTTRYRSSIKLWAHAKTALLILPAMKKSNSYFESVKKGTSMKGFEKFPYNAPVVKMMD
jgi:hypothetical protein